MIELALRCSQTDLNIPQTFPVCQLSKGHAEILVPTGETLDLVAASVAFHTLAKFVNRYKVHQLGKDRTTTVHKPSPSARLQKYGFFQKIFSNRLQPFLPVKPLHSTLYRLLPLKRWDSSELKYQATTIAVLNGAWLSSMLPQI